MAASAVPWLGSRLREERVKRRLTLRGLARDVGVSASMISQIETGKSLPSVGTLYAITSILGISIEGVFAAARPRAPRAVDAVARAAAADAAVAGEAAGGLPATVLDALDAASGRRRGPIVRPADRQHLTLDTGVTWEMLGELPTRPVDFLLVTYPPGASSASKGALTRHAGAEFGYLLAGELTLTLGFEDIGLQPGDAFSFESTTPHGYRNDGLVDAAGVWFAIDAGR